MKNTGFLFLAMIISLLIASIAYAQDSGTLSQTPIPSPTATPDLLLLRKLVTDPECESSCWLGISVAMPEEDLIAILEDRNLSYAVLEIGDSGTLFSYEITGGYSHPFVKPGFLDSILVWVHRGAESEPHNFVASIDIRLNHISVKAVADEFGAPTHITQDTESKAGLMHIIYVGQGVVFTAADDYVYQVGIREDLHLKMAFVDRMFSEPLDICPAEFEICSVAIATPTPIPTLSSTPSSQRR